MAIVTAHLPLPSSPCPVFPAKYHAISAFSMLFSPYIFYRRFDLSGFPTTTSRQIFPTLRPRTTFSSSRRMRTADATLNREPMVPPYNVLITGSTKGIGYALAKVFLKACDNVIICSRSGT